MEPSQIQPESLSQQILDLELELFSDNPQLMKAWRLLSLYQNSIKRKDGKSKMWEHKINFMKQHPIFSSRFEEQKNQNFSSEQDIIRGRKFHPEDKNQRQVPSKSLSPYSIKQNQSKYKKFNLQMRIQQTKKKNGYLSPQKTRVRVPEEKKVSFNDKGIKIERGRKLCKVNTKRRSESPQRIVKKRSKSR